MCQFGAQASRELALLHLYHCHINVPKLACWSMQDTQSRAEVPKACS